MTEVRNVPAAASRLPKVAGYCPMGCGKTLFLGEGGHVTCSWIDCPEPSAAGMMLEGNGEGPEADGTKEGAEVGRLIAAHRARSTNG